MTALVLLGCDPGATGAIALLADDDRVEFIDTPTVPRTAGGTHTDEAALARTLRSSMGRARERFGDDTEFFAVIEQVSARPNDGRTQALRFGESYGALRGVLGALDIRFETVHPSTWKHRLGLNGAEKGASREMACEFYPDAADRLQRVKDHNRAEALLIARWARLVLTARFGERAA